MWPASAGHPAPAFNNERKQFPVEPRPGLGASKLAAAQVSRAQWLLCGLVYALGRIATGDRAEPLIAAFGGEGLATLGAKLRAEYLTCNVQCLAVPQR